MLPLLLIPAALSTALALAPIRRPFPLAVAGWVIGLPALELPLHVGVGVTAVTAGALFTGPVAGPVTTADRVGSALTVLTCGGLAVVVARQRAAANVLDRALEDALPSRDATSTTTTTTTRPPRRHRTPWLAVLAQPWPCRPRGVEARRGLVYGPDARANRCDLYTRGTSSETGGDGQVRGVLIHLHGGHFRAGGPSRESRAMLFDHASRGWAAISATYHLSPTPEGGFPQHLVDVKRMLYWVRSEGARYGIPAGVPVVVAGSSAGAHLAMMTALTAGDPQFQPGFEHADTSLAGVIGLYGYYGRLGSATKDSSDPVRHPATDAPPAAIIHGVNDMYTPVRGSRRLVRHLRSGSSNPVVYAELPGAQHGFDAVQSVRYRAVVAAVRRFTDSLGG